MEKKLSILTLPNYPSSGRLSIPLYHRIFSRVHFAEIVLFFTHNPDRYQMSISGWVLPILWVLFLPQTLQQTNSSHKACNYRIICQKQWKHSSTHVLKRNLTSFSELFVLQLSENLGTELKDFLNTWRLRTDTILKKSVIRWGNPHWFQHDH